MDFILGLILELVFQIVVEFVFSALFEGTKWLFRGRAQRVVTTSLLAVLGGVLWQIIVRDRAEPVLASAVVAGQAALTVVALRGPRPVTRRRLVAWLIDLLIFGVAIVVGRWIGWAVAS